MRVLAFTVLALQAQTAQAPDARRGQASDEANRNKVDEVRAGQHGLVTIFDGTSMRGWSSARALPEYPGTDAAVRIR